MFTFKSCNVTFSIFYKIHSISGPDKLRPTDNIFTCEPDGCVKIRNSFEIDEQPISIPTLVNQAVEKWGDRPALGVKSEYDEWVTINFR